MRNPDPITHYIIIRSDLSRGFLATMITRAAGESGPAPPETYAVVLAVPDEKTLMLWGTALANKGPPHVVIIDRHIKLLAEEKSVPVGKPELMAIGVCPDRKSRLFKHFSCLPLLR